MNCWVCVVWMDRVVRSMSDTVTSRLFSTAKTGLMCINRATAASTARSDLRFVNPWASAHLDHGREHRS